MIVRKMRANRRIAFRGKRIITSDQVREFFAALDHADTLSNRIEQTGKWLLQLLNKYERQERKKDWVIEESELLDKEEYLKAQSLQVSFGVYGILRFG